MSELELDPAVLDLTSQEAIAAILRRIAAFACPCSPRNLLASTVQLLQPISDSESVRDLVAETLDAVTGHGDLVESSEISGASSGRLIYLIPPSFVEISPNLLLLLGGGSDGVYPLPECLVPSVETVNHFRKLPMDDRHATLELLFQAGFFRIDADVWLKAPPMVSPDSQVAKYDALLEKSGPPGALEGASILDHHRPVNYYRGRWSSLKLQSGKFVGRRPQAYGADLWCYMDVVKGEVRTFFDLPTIETRWRGCDEAWHLQQALDAVFGHPQLYRIRRGSLKGTVVVDLFSPIPNWVSRRWECTGMPAAPINCLLSYVFPEAHIDHELHFARERMWLRQV